MLTGKIRESAIKQLRRMPVGIRHDKELVACHEIEQGGIESPSMQGMIRYKWNMIFRNIDDSMWGEIYEE